MGRNSCSAAPAMARLSRMQSSLLRAVATLAASRRRRSSFLVLMFHRVSRQHDPLLSSEPDAEGFAAQIDLVGELLNVLPLSEAVARARTGSLPPRAACITFDDGYANNLDVAAPLLAARRLPATVFIATGYLNGGRMWNDTIIEAIRGAPAELDLTDLALGRFSLAGMPARRAAFEVIVESLKYRTPQERVALVDEIAARTGAPMPDALMLTESGVRQLASHGIEVGAHTMTHPILTAIDDRTAAVEIAGSKRALEDITGTAVSGFAYPNGKPGRDYDYRHVSMVRSAGFDHAVSTAWGCGAGNADLFQIPRVAIWDRTPLRYAARLVRSYAGGTGVSV